MTLHHQNATKEPPRSMQHRTERHVWFHDVPPLATISGAVVATDTETTEAGVVMTICVHSAPGEHHPRVASGVRTSHEGEAMVLHLCVRQLLSRV